MTVDSQPIPPPEVPTEEIKQPEAETTLLSEPSTQVEVDYKRGDKISIPSKITTAIDTDVLVVDDTWEVHSHARSADTIVVRKGNESEKFSAAELNLHNGPDGIYTKLAPLIGTRVNIERRNKENPIENDWEICGLSSYDGKIIVRKHNEENGTFLQKTLTSAEIQKLNPHISLPDVKGHEDPTVSSFIPGTIVSVYKDNQIQPGWMITNYDSTSGEVRLQNKHDNYTETITVPLTNIVKSNPPKMIAAVRDATSIQDIQAAINNYWGFQIKSGEIIESVGSSEIISMIDSIVFDKEDILYKLPEQIQQRVREILGVNQARAAISAEQHNPTEKNLQTQIKSPDTRKKGGGGIKGLLKRLFG